MTPLPRKVGKAHVDECGGRCGMAEVYPSRIRIYRGMGARIQRGIEDKRSGAGLGGWWVQSCWRTALAVRAALARES